MLPADPLDFHPDCESPLADGTDLDFPRASGSFVFHMANLPL